MQNNQPTHIKKRKSFIVGDSIHTTLIPYKSENLGLTLVNQIIEDESEKLFDDFKATFPEVENYFKSIKVIKKKENPEMESVIVIIIKPYETSDTVDIQE